MVSRIRSLSARAAVQPAAPRAYAVNWSRLDTLVVVLFVLGALALFFWRLDQPPRYAYDEVYHAYTAVQLASGNTDAYVWYTRVPEEHREHYRVAYEWSHPAFAKLPMQLGIVLFGDNPFGWRFSNAIWGALGIGILYLLGRIFFDQVVGVLAALLLLFDGLWFVQSRIAMNDTYLVVFLMLAYLAFFRYLNSDTPRRRYLLLCGATLGFALATKWSAVYSFVLLGPIALINEVRFFLASDRRMPWRSLAALVAAFVVLPFVVYLGSYVQFFLMDHTFAEWGELQWQMWRYHSRLRAEHTWASRWWTWPFLIRPVWYFVERGEGTIANVFALGNPVVWWLFLPALAVLCLYWHKQQYRSVGIGLVLLGFFGQWLPWYFSPRISFLYHMLPSVPFGCLAIAYVLRQWWSRRWLVGGYLALVVATFIFFYPHYAAWWISTTYSNLHYWLPTWRP